ncbi:MAG: sulfurtransferase TusA family protein [Desulfatibacillaceae bacterium]
MGETIHHKLDFRGSISPLSLLKMTRVFNGMQPAETMEILGSDPDVRKDLFKLLPPASYEVMLMEVTEGSDYFFRVRIRKSR